MFLLDNIDMEKVFYLDNAATTKPFSECEKIFNESLRDFYNPSASYKEAILVRKKLENARVTLANLLGGKNGRFIFTSSATESNNTVFQGVHLRAGQIVLISKAEHPAVYEAAHRLEKRGIIVKDIPLENTGIVDEQKFLELIDKDVALVSIIHVSNETGAVNDIETLCKKAKEINPKILFHSDGVQAVGKVKINLLNFGVDLYTISGHKIHAPRGIAGLWIKNGVCVDPFIIGGGQEFNLRSSTENVFGALSLQYSCQKVLDDFDQNNAKVTQKRQKIIELLQSSEISCDFKINEAENNSPFILSLSFAGIKGEVLALSLEQEGVLVSTGSACSAKKAGNRVLEAMARSSNEVIGSIRISFSAYEDFDEKFVVDAIIKNVLRFKKNIKK